MVWAQNLVKCPYLVFLVTHIGLWVEWNSQFSSMETHEPQKHQPEILWLSLVFRIKLTLDRLEAWLLKLRNVPHLTDSTKSFACCLAHLTLKMVKNLPKIW